MPPRLLSIVCLLVLSIVPLGCRSNLPGGASCDVDGECAEPFSCIRDLNDPDGVAECLCVKGRHGATCETDEDCAPGEICDFDNCACRTVTPPDDADIDTTPEGSNYACVKDLSTTSTHPNGVSIDAIQNYTGSSDDYPDATTCMFGPNADPTRSDCTTITGPKTFCSGNTGFATLGGAGGWVCGHFATEIANGHFLTPAGCNAGEALPIEVSICDAPDPASPSCKPCPLTADSLGRSCDVSGL